MSEIRSVDIPALVSLARRVIAPTWSLDSVVAVNPLQGLEELPFERAIERARHLFGSSGYLSTALRTKQIGNQPYDIASYLAAAESETSSETSLQQLEKSELPQVVLNIADTVDVFVTHWFATHGTDSGQFDTWKKAALRDPDLRRWTRGQHVAMLDNLDDNPSAIVALLLQGRGATPQNAIAFLEAQLGRVPGWAAALAREDEKNERYVHAALIDLVAIRLTVEYLLTNAPALPIDLRTQERTNKITNVFSNDVASNGKEAQWQVAAELAYRDHLLQKLKTATRVEHKKRPKAQSVFCIDVRSEGIRRNFEALDNYETLGFAGFFGLAIEVQPIGFEKPVASCPVIVNPRATIREQMDNGSTRNQHDREIAHRAFHSAEHGRASGFALADASGWFLGIRTLTTTLVPDIYDRVSSLKNIFRRKSTSTFVIDQDPNSARFGMDVDQQSAMAYGALAAMGLTHNFAPLVVICGHRSSNRNNPFRSALDCGACGGNPGGPNARILAQLCNRESVRKQLATKNVVIPDDTWFVAGEHETTDDVVTILDQDAIPSSHRELVAQVLGDLNRAGVLTNHERQARMPCPPKVSRKSLRSVDPAQIVPDWGLARCAAIVVGPRSLTAGLDLDRRVFLHSYAPDQDHDGLVLEAIMTGPVVVAHWISSQYYFSTVDPNHFGSGSKVLQNVIGRLGVSEGASLNLRIGLPLESVWFDGAPVHDPLRLFVVVDAPTQRIDEVLSRNPSLRRLFDNGWARLGTADFQLRGRSGEWAPWNDSQFVSTTLN